MDLDSILQTIMDKMAEYFRPENWSLLMVDEEQEDLYFAIAVGNAAESLKNVRLKVGEGIAGWVAKHGEQLIVPDVIADPRFAKRIDEMTQLGDPLHHLRPAALQAPGAGSDPTGQREHGGIRRAGTVFSPGAVRLRRHRHRERPLGGEDSGTHHHRRLHRAFNARHLYKTLEAEVYRSSRFGYEFTVLFIDLDHFKQVNDTHGHLIGSKLLAEIGYLVKAQLRLIDFAFRYGGDEFVILLPQTGKDAALVVARRLRDTLRTMLFCKEEGLNLNVRASIGVATFPHDAKSPHDIIRQADEMMYMVKNTTRDNIGIAQRGVMK